MSALYSSGRQKFLTGSLDWLTDNFKLVLLDNTYVFDDNHDNLNDITGVIATSGNLTNKTAVNGIADADDVIFTSVAAGPDIAYVVVYYDSGSASTSTLIAYYDITTTGASIDITPTGDAVGVYWSNSALKMFRL